MENNVVTLDTAKQLKAAGFPQTIALAWLEYGADGPGLIEIVGAMRRTPSDDWFAAPTAQEIADQLKLTEWAMDNIDGYSVRRLEDDGGFDENWETRGTMAEALASLYLKLHEANIKGQHQEEGE